MGVVGSPLWSPEEDQHLRKLAAAGCSAATISERLKRSASAVRGHASKLNIPLDPARKIGLKVKGE